MQLTTKSSNNFEQPVIARLQAGRRSSSVPVVRPTPRLALSAMEEQSVLGTFHDPAKRGDGEWCVTIHRGRHGSGKPAI